ncbi:hypothetical protein [Rubellicoccus peritrichatus]|uniref:Uncharacterized protein n=1 Tax=Rubellicoccus peritrichatus TaxID=3080537 RepID=A0AAQ3QQR2_9BACT|nr:hypothetical protein [Puniceicoccus sp. CR14]WOO40391.1 hypothetical protein RZN69_17365 [Puniceicoccus sp. CR14]WOO40440.1 hypothetical protein RZN69_17610 [Puniceicoccus sp. CR14]WOO40489.1 hypothetical protein RZN69_17855 [Puniceicoccus sp. CR14]WOO40538.1 hypothetical protein RZN69_18100 [Puniceicoccus sp. CR14]
MVPTKEENPNGLHQKYVVTKADGSSVDPDAEYFVLRLDYKGGDVSHVRACRAALSMYAKAIQERIPDLANDLKERYDLHHPFIEAWLLMAKRTHQTNCDKGFVAEDGNIDHGTQFMLMVCELCEAFEAFRSSAPDDKLPWREGREVELGDTVIRIMNYATQAKLNVAPAMIEKDEYNQGRPYKHGGKKF